MKIDDIELQIEKSWYHKTILQEDGVTQMVDVSKRYPYYQFIMAKNYLQVESKEEMLALLVEDLKKVTVEMEKQLEKERTQNAELEKKDSSKEEI